MNIQKKNILLTSSSSKISMYKLICQAAKIIDKEIRVIPADANKNVLSYYMSDEFKTIPKIKDQYLSEMIEIFGENKIGIIFPRLIQYFRNYLECCQLSIG